MFNMHTYIYIILYLRIIVLIMMYDYLYVPCMRKPPLLILSLLIDGARQLETFLFM